MTDGAGDQPRPDTEALRAEGMFIDELADPELFSALLASQAKAISAVERASSQLQAAINAALAILKKPSSRLFYCGAGTSGRIALLDAVELGPTFNWPDSRMKVILAGGEGSFLQAQEGAEDDEEAARTEIQALALCADDVVVGLAASGTTPFVIAALAEARRAGALTIGFANNPATPVLNAVHYPVLLETGAEALAGSTRLSAGTSQKIAVNIFSTGLMIRLGKVYKGRMVDMQVINRKLRARAVAIVHDIVGCTEGHAREALVATNYDIKQAVLVATGIEPQEAAKVLAECGGMLAQAMRQIGRHPSGATWHSAI